MSAHGSFGHDEEHAGHSNDNHGHDDHGGTGKYIVVFVALCVLTAISFAVGNSPAIMANKGVGWTLMMVVSCAKASLVILFFMHLKWEANWKYVLTIPASMMSIFLLLMLMPDIKLRGNHYSEERLLHSANSEDAIVPSLTPGQSSMRPAGNHK